ncbi:MAG: CotH kinase family protein [Silvanigrellales bacterium]|nr:CotH kinase family protein [Silvanigrellales bacterium]
MRSEVGTISRLKNALLFAWIPALVVSLCGCGSVERLDSFGVTKVELRFEPQDLGHMRADLFTKIRKRAKIRLEGEEGHADVRYSGQYTILSPKKSMDLKLEKPLEFKKGRRIRLLGQPTDSTALRNDLGYAVFADAGFPTPKRELAFVYINDKPQGLYLLTEALTEDFLASRKLPFLSLYQGKLGSADFTISTPEELDTPFQPEHDNGNNADLVHFLSELQKAETPEAIRALSKRVDVPDFMRYFAVATFLQHWDGQTNNFYIYRDTTTNLFRIIPWDLDKIWLGAFSPGNNVGSNSDAPRGYEFYRENALSQKLFLIPEYKEMYRAELERLFKAWPIARIEKWLKESGERIEPAWRQDRGYAERGTTHTEERALLVSKIKSWFTKVAPYAQKGGSK